MIKKKIADIQIFRALAIILVLLQHFSLTATASQAFPVRFYMPFYVGVELFFVISGYVVAKSFFSGEQINPPKFLIKRVFRIYPALLLFILLAFLINLIFYSLNLSDNLNLLFIIPWNKFFHLSTHILLGTFINQPVSESFLSFGAMWSLSVEFQFYAFVTLVGFILLFLTRPKKACIESIFFVFFIAVYLLITTSRILLLFGHKPEIYLIQYIINYNFDFLLLGFVVAIAEKKGWLDKLLTISRETSIFLSPLLLILPLALVAISESPFAENRRILQGFSLPISALCFTILVYLAANVGCFPGTKTRIYRFFSWLGDRSYSIYLFHLPLMSFVWILLYNFMPSAFSNPWHYGIYQAFITILLLLPLVEIVYLKIELPLIEYSHTILAKKSDSLSQQPNVLSVIAHFRKKRSNKN